MLYNRVCNTECGIIQIQMDGPNVNFAFLRSFEKSLREKQLLDLGSCGLHTLNGALQFGFDSSDSPDWDISQFLKSIYYLFHESPARRGEYLAVVGEKKFPMKFCPTRWTENVKVVDRALELLDSLKKYVDAVESKHFVEIDGTPSKLTVPKNNSFKIVQKAVQDPLLEARLWFFRSCSSEVLDFLTKFQCDQPVSIFLYGELQSIFKNFLRRIVKREVAESWSTTNGLKCLDDENLLPIREVDIGFTLAATRSLRKHRSIKEKFNLEFRMDARTILVLIVKKIWERSPLSKPLTKSLSGFNPECFLTNQNRSEVRIRRVMEMLVDGDHIGLVEAEDCLRQWKKFVCDEAVISEARSFKPFCDRIDDFYYHLMADSQAYSSIFKIMKKILILSIGNALVERGVSANKHLLQDNLLEETVVLVRHAYDGIKRAGGPNHMVINQQIMNACRVARSRCLQAREARKALDDSKKKQQEERMQGLKEIRELQAVKRKLQDDSEAVEDRLRELNKKCRL